MVKYYAKLSGRQLRPCLGDTWRRSPARPSRRPPAPGPPCPCTGPGTRTAPRRRQTMRGTPGAGDTPHSRRGPSHKHGYSDRQTIDILDIHLDTRPCLHQLDAHLQLTLGTSSLAVVVVGQPVRPADGLERGVQSRYRKYLFLAV